MDAVRSASSSTAAASLERMVASCGAIDAFLASHFTLGNLAAAEATFASAPSAGPNEAVAVALATAKTALADAVSGMALLKRWIQLHVPKVEDGNNFGVGIQLDTVKMLTEKAKELKGLLDELHKYHAERAGLLKDVVPTSSRSLTESEGSSESRGGEKDENKTSKNSNAEAKTSTPAPLADQVSAVAALDARWYYHAAYVLTEVQTAQYVVCDIVEKNRDKIERPKGDSGSHFSSF